MTPRMNAPMNTLKKTAVASILLGILISIAYSNTVEAPFHFDDRVTIVENERIHDLSNMWPPTGSRYVNFLSFAVNYSISGLDTRGYHLTNIAIHWLVSVLVFSLALVTLRIATNNLITDTHGGGSEKGGNDGILFSAALLPALLFALHPIETQAVNYITQRGASLATLFYLTSVLAYILFRLRDLEDRRGRACYYGISLLSCIIAMKTKEFSFTLPFIIAIFDLSFFHPQGVALRERLKPLIPFGVTLLIIPMSSLDAGVDIAEVTAATTRLEYLLTQLSVLLTYFKLLLLPAGQSLDYEYPVTTSLFSFRAILPLVIHLAIFALGIRLLLRKDILKVTGFGIIWFYMTISVESSIIPLLNLVFVHRLYLPTTFLFIALSPLIIKYCDGRFKRAVVGKVLLLGAVLLSAALLPATYSRNEVWKSPVTLWKDVTEKEPLRARGHYNYGRSLKDEGDIEGALREYKETVRLKGDHTPAYSNIGNIYFKRGRYTEALEAYLTALKHTPDDPITNYNLGNLYLQIKNLDAAGQYLKRAIELEPTYTQARSTLGQVYVHRGMLGEAIGEFRRALELDPAYTVAMNNLGAALYMSGDLNGAIETFEEVIGISPEYMLTYYNLGELYLEAGDKERAKEKLEYFLERSAKDNPNRAFAEEALKRADED